MENIDEELAKPFKEAPLVALQSLGFSACVDCSDVFSKKKNYICFVFLGICSKWFSTSMFFFKVCVKKKTVAPRAAKCEAPTFEKNKWTSAVGSAQDVRF